jgi:cytidine deaminase
MIDQNELYEEVYEARKLSYSPYSKFKVGAVIKLKNGKYIKGANIENSSYPLSMCAERCAIYSAYAQGYTIDDFEAFAIIGDTQNPISPCGACRQVMSELLPRDINIYLFNLKHEVKIITIDELLPYAFDGEDL